MFRTLISLYKSNKFETVQPDDFFIAYWVIAQPDEIRTGTYG